MESTDVLHKILNTLDAAGAVPVAEAHCDIPCKIYDPAVAQIAALSVVRLMDIAAEAAEKTDTPALAMHNTLTRCTLQKEEEAEKVKKEIRVIWGDYFKAPQFEKCPDAHDVAHQIMLKASACKQGMNRADGEALVELVNQFAEMFWLTKDVATERKTCPYPPSLEVVRPAL